MERKRIAGRFAPEHEGEPTKKRTKHNVVPAVQRRNGLIAGLFERLHKVGRQLRLRQPREKA